MNILKFTFLFFFFLVRMLSTSLWSLHKWVGVSLGYTTCHLSHRFVGSGQWNFSRIPKWLHLFVFEHGHRSMLSTWVHLTMPLCFWSEYTFAANFCSLDASVVLIPFFGTRTKSAHTKYSRALEAFLRIWVDEEVFLFLFFVQYPEYIPSIHPSSYPDPQNSPHSLTKVELLVSFCLNLFVDFISQHTFLLFSFPYLRIPCISSWAILTINSQICKQKLLLRQKDLLLAHIISI